MSDPLPLDSNELTPEDRNAIREFLETEDFATTSSSAQDLDPSFSSQAGQAGALEEASEEEEMLAVFATEVDEDIDEMQRALAMLRQDQAPETSSASSALPPGSLSAVASLRRRAHKIRGTSAAIGCSAMSTIAHTTERLLDLGRSQKAGWTTVLLALESAVEALADTLELVVTRGQESIVPLLALQESLQELQLPLNLSDEDIDDEPDEAGAPSWPATSGKALEQVASTLNESHHLEALIQHVEQLSDQQCEIEVAHRKVQAALTVLRLAQARLRQIEAVAPGTPAASLSSDGKQTSGEELAPSPLIARILRESGQRTGHTYQPGTRELPSASASSAPLAETMLWDEIERKPFAGTQGQAHALAQAIADVESVAAQLQGALSQLDALVRQQAINTSLIQDDVLSLQTLSEPGLAEQIRQATRMASYGLLVRAGEQQVIVPFSQVQRIDYASQPPPRQVYALHDLLGLAAPPRSAAGEPSPMLILRARDVEGEPLAPAILVDEVPGQNELRVRPLPTLLQRPGVTGAAITPEGEVALVLDLPMLIQRYEQRAKQVPLP